MRKILKRRWAFLFALAALVAFAGIAWAGYGAIYFTGVSGNSAANVILRNNTTTTTADNDTNIIPASALAAVSFDVVPTTEYQENSVGSKVHFYFSDGASSDSTLEGAKVQIDKISFKLNYGFKAKSGTTVIEGSAQDTADNIVATSDTTDITFDPTTILLAANDHGFVANAHYKNNATNVAGKKINVNSHSPGGSPTNSVEFAATEIKVNNIAATAITGGSDSLGGADTGLMYTKSHYGKLPSPPTAGGKSIVPSADIAVEIANNNYVWDLKSIQIAPNGTSSFGGMATVRGVTAKRKAFTNPSSVSEIYNNVAHIEFFGKPASDEQIDFIVQGTVVEKNAPYKPVLRNVSKLVSITPEETNIAVTTDPSGNTLTFPNNGDLREITVYFPDGVTPKPAEFPGTTGFATNYYNANLYEANGMPIFANGKSDAYIAGYKLTVTRTRVQGGKKIIYSFTGDPDATTSGYFELYPGGVFANGDWYLLDPIAISVNNGTPPTPTTVNLAPSSLTRTAGTSFTSDPIYITGGVTIAGLGLTDNATPANSVSPFAGVTATVNSPNSSFTVKGNTSIVDTKTVYVFYYQNGKLLSQPFSVTINPAPGAPSLSISTSDKHISANVGEAMTPRIITVTPSSGTNLQVRVSQTFYRGVSFDVQSSGNTIRVYGTPTLTSGGAQQISVAGTVLINDTRVDATATSFDITITDNTPAPPDMTLNPSSISDLVAGTPVSGRSVTIVQSPSSPLLSITGFSTASDGTAGTAGAHVRIWNGLTLTASGGKITITGTPEKAGDAKFTLAGTIGTDNVTATLTLSVKSAPASANLFSNWTAWTLNPNIAARTATLDIPVTSEFVAAFGTGGKVTTADIKAVGLDVDSPYAALKEPVKFAIVSGGTYGTLRLTLEFDQPASGHANDWYEDIEIDLIEVTGANNATKWSSYASNPIALDDLKQTGGSTGSGGGCDAGFAGAALLLAGAFFAVSKARKR